ncbi:glycine zipper 2TM domain-containing protein [Chelativorans sp. M5D2P16]|uniref:glycine zipper 2TM domain-containing protein n=1 Tax=Chelativorans sp. M5D2P16 TaxID=3095678 RepID=UPI002ACA74AC|nr:glycine zipper 2TM domain-containing protein [Chelativorans sp. M5D2P16]MDZ5697627.1 glycine zipper 2TM domain-containing protein [Chelativorans sp. M5D2P16]
MKIRKWAFVPVVLLAVALAGCAANEQQQRAGTGALLGAGAGALAGQALGRDTKSTLAGAAGGAILGGVIGSATTPRRQGQEFCRYRAADGSIYTAPCDERY